jgi:hypothetical protein
MTPRAGVAHDKVIAAVADLRTVKRHSINALRTHYPTLSLAGNNYPRFLLDSSHCLHCIVSIFWQWHASR